MLRSLETASEAATESFLQSAQPDELKAKFAQVDVKIAEVRRLTARQEFVSASLGPAKAKVEAAEDAELKTIGEVFLIKKFTLHIYSLWRTLPCPVQIL